MADMHPAAPRLRGLLFTPGDSARKTAKALASNADGVILDLEDAVAPDAKDTARRMVGQLLRGTDRPGLMVRINPPDSAAYLPDLVAIIPGRPAAVLLPKCTGAADLRALDHHLAALEAAYGLPVGQTRVLLLATESAAAVARLDYAGVSQRLTGLCFAAEDLAADLGIAPRWPDGTLAAPLRHARAALVLAAAAAGVAALDTPFPDTANPAGLASEAAMAAQDGFAGKLCIHPAQLETVNAAFTPSPDQLRWARAVRDAFAARTLEGGSLEGGPSAGVIQLDGRMLDRPHLRLALSLLRAASETADSRRR